MTVPCVKCGYCCRVGLCSYGEMDAIGQCQFLKVDDPEMGTWKCARYNEIKRIEENSQYPMFDEYCSGSVLNTVREAIIKKMATSALGEK